METSTLVNFKMEFLMAKEYIISRLLIVHKNKSQIIIIKMKIFKPILLYKAYGIMGSINTDFKIKIF